MGDFSEKNLKSGGVTTTPPIVPSAKIEKKLTLTLEPQGFEGCQISASFWRVFGEFLVIF